MLDGFLRHREVTGLTLNATGKQSVALSSAFVEGDLDTDSWYALNAAAYLRLEADGVKAPAKTLAERLSVSVRVVNDRIARAKRLGLIDAAPRERGGRLTPRALELLNHEVSAPSPLGRFDRLLRDLGSVEYGELDDAEHVVVAKLALIAAVEPAEVHRRLQTFARTQSADVVDLTALAERPSTADEGSVDA